MKKTIYTLAIAVACVATACGGTSPESEAAASNDSSAAPTTASVSEAPVTTNEADEPDTATTLAVQALSDGNEDTTFYGNPPGTGTVEVGDIRYEFDLDILCLSMFGAMGVAGGASDGSDISVDADFPPEGWETSADDWEPPSISISDDERDISWQSGGTAAEIYPEGSSQIDSFTADGSVAFGEATFANSYTFGDDLEVETGRFEFRCPSE